MFKVSRILMMSDYEEDLDDFPTFSAENRPIQQFGAAASGITTKIPPLFDGSTSWFPYEELIDDWLDLTVLEESKRGPQRTSQSRIYESRRWSQVFQEYVETPFHQGTSKCFPLDILSK